MIAYVADTKQTFNDGAVHVVDLDTARIVRSLPALHNPDVALSPDGRQLFVVHANLDKHVAAPDRDELLVYDTATFELVRKATFTWRSLYNVAPSGPSLVVSEDGRFVYVNKTETLGDDAANNTMSVFDVQAGVFQQQEIRLPYQVTSYGTVPGSRKIHFGLSGRLGDAVACVDLDQGLELKLRHDFGQQDAMHRSLAGSAAHPFQALVYMVSKQGYLQCWRLESDSLDEAIRLDLKPGSAVPIPHILVTANEVLVGVSDSESAAQGLSNAVCAYQPESSAGCVRTLTCDPPAEKLALSGNHRQIVGLNRRQRVLTSYDLASGKRIARVTGIGTSPVSFVVSPS